MANTKGAGVRSFSPVLTINEKPKENPKIMPKSIEKLFFVIIRENFKKIKIVIEAKMDEITI
jgi:GT2 family glycosyltransferase